MAPSSIIHLVYASVATQMFSKQQLRELLEKSRKANKIAGLTGMLLHSDGNFFQVLEGKPADVDTLYSKMRQDTRHHQVTLIIREPIPKRYFADWSMGFSEVTTKELATIVGLNDFFAGGSCFADLDAGRAKKLLTAFAGGRWHVGFVSAMRTAV